MWNVIIIVCAACIIATIAGSIIYVRKKKFDPAATMKAIALSAAAVLVFAIPVVARLTYTIMSDGVEKEKAEVKKQKAEAEKTGRDIVEAAGKTAATIRAEAKEEELRSKARVKAVRDSIRAAEKVLKTERRKAEKVGKINKIEQAIQDRQKTIEKQAIRIEELNRNIELLKHTALSIGEFQQIAEMALLRTDIKWTRIYRDPVSDSRKSGDAAAKLGTKLTSALQQNDYVTDEIFMVYTKSLNDAKFGFDLNRVMIAKQGGNYVISGISAKYIGAEKPKVRDELAEYRRTGYKKDGLVNTIEIKKDKMSLQRVDEVRKRYTEIISETGIEEIEEIKYLNDAVVVLAQNFLKVMLAPLCKNNEDCIKFTGKEPDKSYQLMEYLKNELYANEAQWKELSSSIEQAKDQITKERAAQNELLESWKKGELETEENDDNGNDGNDDDEVIEVGGSGPMPKSQIMEGTRPLRGQP